MPEQTEPVAMQLDHLSDSIALVSGMKRRGVVFKISLS
jgi:hypothetical protein